MKRRKKRSEGRLYNKKEGGKGGDRYVDGRGSDGGAARGCKSSLSVQKLLTPAGSVDHGASAGVSVMSRPLCRSAEEMDPGTSGRFSAGETAQKISGSLFSSVPQPAS